MPIPAFVACMGVWAPPQPDLRAMRAVPIRFAGHYQSVGEVRKHVWRGGAFHRRIAATGKSPIRMTLFCYGGSAA